jgi:hypothetical protein
VTTSLRWQPRLLCSACVDPLIVHEYQSWEEAAADPLGSGAPDLLCAVRCSSPGATTDGEKETQM